VSITERIRGALKGFRSAGILESPSTPLSGPVWWMLSDGLRNSEAGVRVTAQTALESAAVQGCIRLLSDSAASLPLRLYKSDPANPMHRQEIRSHPVSRLCGLAPNPDMTPMTFYSVLVTQLCLWGNAYAEVQRDSNKQPLALWPRAPHLTRVMRDDDGVLFFDCQDTPDSKWRRIEAEDMVHVVGLSVDGLVGLDTIKLARQEVGNALAQTIHSGRYYKNFATPSVAITAPEKVLLKPEQKSQMRQAWEELQSGPSSHRVAILDQGQQVQVLSSHAVEADLVNAMKEAAVRICFIYRVPPTLLGITDKAPRASAEVLDASYLKYSLGPILCRLEQAMQAKLAPTASYSMKFDTRSLLRASMQDRAAYFNTMRLAGILSANEARAMEDLPPIPGGDRYLEPANMNEVSGSSNKEELDEEIEDAQDTDY
jgi:HK97 family phage portal protein